MRTMKSQIKLKKWNKEMFPNTGYILCLRNDKYERFYTKQELMEGIKMQGDNALWVFDLSERITINHEVEIVDEIDK